MARTKQTNRQARPRPTGCDDAIRYRRDAEDKLDDARTKSAMSTKPTFEPDDDMLQWALASDKDISILVGESRSPIKTYSRLLEDISPYLFKCLIAENFKTPCEGEPPFEFDLKRAAVAPPDGVCEVLGSVTTFYLRYNDEQVLEPLKQPVNFKDFEGRFVPNALKLIACGEFFGIGESEEKEQGEGSAQGSAVEGGSSRTVKVRHPLVRHVQYAVLTELENASEWMDDDEIDKHTSYFKAALALLRACQASPQCCDAMAKLEEEVMAELSIMLGPLVDPCLALGELLGTDCSQEPCKALLDTTIKCLVTPQHKGKIPVLANYMSKAKELVRAVELLIEAEKPEDVKDFDRQITKTLLNYASSHKQELEDLSVHSPSEYKIFKDHLNVEKLTTKDLDEYRKELVILEPAKLTEAMNRRLRQLQRHVQLEEDGDGRISVHNPLQSCEDKCEEMNMHKYKIPDSMLTEPYSACSEFICLSNCLWELRVSPNSLTRNMMELDVEIRPARPNAGNRGNARNSLKYPTCMSYTMACAGIVVVDQRHVSMGAVPDKGAIGWIHLKSIRKLASDLRGQTITLRFATPEASRKRSRDGGGELS